MPFPPSREAELVTFSTNFTNKINATPTQYGLTAAQATAYQNFHDAFVGAYNTANDPMTRSPGNVELKNVAKANLVTELRSLAAVAQAFPGITNALRIDLGLPTRGNEPVPSPIPEAPKLVVEQVNGRTVTARLIDVDNPLKRGRPVGTLGASWFSYVGAHAPADLSQWKFEFNSGRTTVDVEFPSDTPAGAQVYLTAFWFNGRKESSDACDPVPVTLGGGSVSMAA